MKTRIKIIEKKFYVNLTKETVVCELLCDLQKEKHPAFPYLYQVDFKNWDFVGRDGRFRVKAKAQCAEGDTFDIKRGKMIAESKAKAKMCKAAARVWNYYFNTLHAAALQCLSTSCKCDVTRKSEEKHVKDLIKDETHY